MLQIDRGKTAVQVGGTVQYIAVQMGFLEYKEARSPESFQKGPII